MNHEATIIRAVLDDLCRACGVSPADGSADAGRAVLKALPAGERSDPAGCGLHLWLRERVRGEFLVTPERVLLLGKRNPEGGRETAHVPLPAAVRAAVALADRGRVGPLAGRVRANRKERLAVPCPRCGTVREKAVPTGGRVRTEALARLCPRCAYTKRREAAA